MNSSAFPSATHSPLLRTVLIDDESSGRAALKSLLALHCPEVVVVGEAVSIEEAFRKIHNIDLAFLDIELPDGTGFDLLEEIGPRSFEVIIVTAYDHHGIRAVKAGAADYLLKPVSAEELRQGVARAVERFGRRQNMQAAAHLQAEEIPQRLALPNAEGLIIVDIATILRCRSHSNYTEFHIADGRTLLVSRSMGEYEKLLVRSGFFRVHNSHIINMRHVRSYVRGKGGYVIMADGSHIEVSARRKEAFLRMLNG